MDEHPARKCMMWPGNWWTIAWRSTARRGLWQFRTKSCQHKVPCFFGPHLWNPWWWLANQNSNLLVMLNFNHSCFHASAWFSPAIIEGANEETDTTGVMEARLQPWMADCLSGFNNGIRRADNEGMVCICNLTTQGVVSADKLHFALQQLTTLSHAFPKTFIAVVVMPNRAGDVKGCKLLWLL